MKLLFHEVYKIADLMISCISVQDSFDELDWTSCDVSRCLTNFSKISLLGHFCFTHISMYQYRKARKDPETIDVEFVEEGLAKYEVPFVPYVEFLKLHPDLNEDDADPIYEWFCTQSETFDQMWASMTDEVVHLLFGNRHFLLEFNQGLAEFRRERGDKPSPRVAIPQWVKKAVYFRENGRCALCKKDLSGLIAIDPKQHYDHIVSLKALKANDPCNIQLLCATCNLTKAASRAHTSSEYEPWWRTKGEDCASLKKGKF